MKRLMFSAAAVLAVACAVNASDEPVKKTRRQLTAATPGEVASSAGMPAADRQNVTLPPAPEGVTDLKFGELFKNPAGPRGLEFTDKLASLDGKRVRILGFMVNDDSALPGQMLLSPVPLTLHTEEYGFCDDLPASVVTVHVQPRESAKEPKVLPYTPGLLLLTGTLSVGNQEEKSGRISSVRLTIDEPKDMPNQSSPATPLSAGPNSGGHHHNH